MNDVTDRNSWYRRAAALVVTVGVLMSALSPAWAVDPEDRLREVEKQLDQAQEELNHSTAALTTATQAYQTATAALPAAEAALTAAQQGLAAAQNALQVAQGELAAARAADAAAADKLAEAEKKVKDQEAKIDVVTQRIDDKRASISHVAVEAYQRGAGGEVASLAAALQADSLLDLAEGVAASESVVDAENSIMTDLKDDRAELANQRVVLEDLRAEAERLRVEAAAKLEETKAREAAAQAAKDEAERATQAAAAAKSEVDQLISTRQGAMTAAEAAKAADAQQYAQWESERTSIQAEIDRIERERRDKENEENENPDPPSDDDDGGGGGGGGGGNGNGLQFPVANPYVTSPFGMRVHPVTGIYKLHDGTDFRAHCGTPIRSALDGVVEWAGYRGAYGNQVAVSGGRYVTTYSHLSGFGVGDGERVSRGEIIGYSGTTGSSTACHLHFMVYRDGDLKNPMDYL